MLPRIPTLAAGALAILAVGAAEVRGAGKPVRAEDRAARAAVAATRGGKAMKVAREDEGGAAREVEVWLPKGRKVDVLLDSRYRVLKVSDENDPGDFPSGIRATGDTSARSASYGRRAHLAARAAARAVGGGVLLDVDREPLKGVAWEVEFMKLDGTRVVALLDDRLKVVRVTRGKFAN